jgi:glucokinase
MFEATEEIILSAIPVFLMNDQNSGLWGAAFYGQQLLR